MFLRNDPLDLDYLKGKDWWSKVLVGEPDECWPWRQSTASHGYGQTWDGKTVKLSHRVAWALHHDRQVPDGMTVDHICHNRPCCNPAHLQLLTNVDNATKNKQGEKVECPRGHPYEGENLYVCPKGHRRCRECARITKRERIRGLA